MQSFRKAFLHKKTEILLELAMHNRLCTLSFFVKRKIMMMLEDICPFCISRSETIDHILFHCPISWNFWNIIVSWWAFHGAYLLRCFVSKMARID